MEEDIMVTMQMTKKKDMGNFHGLMADVIKDNGLMTQNMELELILIIQEKRKEVNGQMGNSLNG